MKLAVSSFLTASVLILSLEASSQETDVLWMNIFESNVDGWGSNSPVICSDTDDNFYLADNFRTSITIHDSTYFSSSGSLLFAKFNYLGELLKATQFSSSEELDVTDIKIDEANNTWLAGHFKSDLSISDTALISDGHSDAFLAEFDSTLSLVRSVTVGGQNHCATRAVLPSHLSGTVLVGEFEGTVDFADTGLVALYSQDGFVCKYDEDLNTDWVVHIKSDSWVTVNSVNSDDHKNIYVVGNRNGDLYVGQHVLLGSSGTFVLKISPSGEPTWLKRLPSLLNGHSRCSVIDNNNSLYIGGSFYGLNGQASIIKLDSNGDLLWQSPVGDFTCRTLSITEPELIIAAGSLQGRSNVNGEAFFSDSIFVGNAGGNYWIFETNLFQLILNTEGDVLDTQHLDALAPTTYAHGHQQYNSSSSNGSLTFLAGSSNGGTILNNQDSIMGSGILVTARHLNPLTLEEDDNAININQPSFYCYPNPANETIAIKADNFSKKSELKIIDLKGKVILSCPYSGKSIDVTNLTPGVYIIQLFLSENVMYQRFVKH